ncbi:MAG: PBSX family phage terminase large subunit [Peptoniphilus sp.]|nr:PBSX family phage terminase large subunit [Peptoniphilus sp.]MDY3118194.1 PBSX family phage terminase large subunit [Peptoniphilus sp.]
MRDRVMYLPEIVGGGYRDFWKYKGRYRVVKGSRASKKSTTTALNMIYRIMQYPKSNGMVVRKTYRTLKDSCFNQLKWAIHRLGVDRYWRATVAPLELVYKPTGQKILFRGLDDPIKVTSVTVDTGVLCFLWIEEAYEVLREKDFDMLDESIRGEVPEGLFKQITLTLNPWNDRHWIKRRFFDTKDEDVLAMTTNYMCNEWLDASDLALFERMKKNNPKRYRVAGLGEWGVVEGLIFENVEERPFDVEAVKGDEHCTMLFGLDFGYTNDPTAFFVGAVDKTKGCIYVMDEVYKRRMTNKQIYKEIARKGYASAPIIADSAEPKSIAELKHEGMRHIKPSRKGRDSVLHGIQFIQDFRMIVHPQCVHFMTEVLNYRWDEDKQGVKLNRPIDDFNHLIDAMRYSLEPHMRPPVYSFQ